MTISRTLFGMPFLALPQDCVSCEGMVLIVSLLCSGIRNVKLPHFRMGAILLFKSCSLYIEDEDRLQHVLPYVIAMLSYPQQLCSVLCWRLCDILPLVQDFPPSDANIFLEYILPALKLASDSFSISNNSRQFHRVVHEAEGRENDQTAYVSSKFQDSSISGTMKGSPITAEDGPTPTEVTGLLSFTRASSIPDSGWRPRGVLVAHLQKHRSAVNDISISTDHSFFVSASDDSTVKVWDSRKLEKDISFRSRQTYSLEGSRALCIAMLQGSAQVVVGACDGMIHMFPVDYISRGLGNVVEKYTGIADVKRKSVGDGAILNLLNYSADSDSRQIIMYSTQNCGIHLWDTRTNINAWHSKVNPEEGYVFSLVTGPCGNWFVSGSSRGYSLGSAVLSACQLMAEFSCMSY